VPQGVRVQVPSSPHFTKNNHTQKKDYALKIETQPRDDHQVTLIVELEPEQMEGAKHRAARKISEKKSIPGFRPGKAPYEVVVRSFGESVISEEAVDILLDEVYPKALEDAKLEPAAAGSLEKVEDLDKKPKFTFTVPLAPITNLEGYRKIRLPYDWKEPGEDKVEEAIKELRRMYAKTESVTRAIETGDFVMIDLKGVKGKAVEGEVPLIDRPGLPVFVNDGEKEDEYPFKGFSKELIGMNVDENKSFIHKYEKKYKDEKLQGQVLNFTVTVKMVRGSILPELNDEFAKQVGPFENLKALHDAVGANLATQSKAEYDDDYFGKLIEKIKETAVIKYPPQVLNHELEHVMEDLKSRLAEQGLDMTAYLKSREMDEERFTNEEARPIAVKRLERSLIMDELARLEKIDVTQELLQSTFQQTWGEYQGNANFQKSMRGKSQPPKQVMNAVAMESANRAYVQQTLNRLKDIATGQAPELEPETSESISLKKANKSTLKGKRTSGLKPSAGENATVKPASPRAKSSPKVSKDPKDNLISTKGKKPSPKK
jgi:trigger factor